MAKKKVTVVKSPKLLVNNVQKKPSEKSKLLGKLVLGAFDGKKDGKVEKFSNHEVLSEILRSIFTGNSSSIKDDYATLVTYLILHCKEISYDVFTGIYESVKMNSESNNVSLSLPYGALISSGIILKWEPEQQNQIVSKMLRIYQNDANTSDIIFHFLILLDSKVKLSTHKLKKVNISLPRELYFMLSVDSKQESADELISSKDLSNLIEVFFKECDPNVRNNLSDLFAKKMLSFDEDSMYKIWGKIETTQVSNPCNKVQLLASILENLKEKSVDINRLFTTSIIKALSTSAQLKPEYTQSYKSLQTSLTNIVLNMSFDIKFKTLTNIILNCKSFINKLMIVKLSFLFYKNIKFEEVEQVIELFKDIILNKRYKIDSKKQNKEFKELEKVFIIKQFSQSVGSLVSRNKIDWRLKQIKFLFELGFLNDYKDMVTPFVQNAARQTFFECLNHKCYSLKDLDLLLSKLIKFVSKKIADKDDILVVQFRDEAHNLWFKSISFIKGLKENDETIVFKILLQYMMLCIFQSYSNSKSTLEELFKIIEDKELEGSSHWTEVMIDLYLQLLSNEDALHKSIVNCTFSHICKFMTNKGLNLILTVIRGDNIDDDEEMELNEEENDSDESGDASESDNESDSENENSESESDDDLPEHEGQIDKLKDALRQELFKLDTASTCGSVDLDDLNEEEGKALNATLGEIFKLQSNKFKSSNKKKVDNLELQFRIRVVELLETFIESKPSLYFCTVIITSLISSLKICIPNHTLAPLVVCIKKCFKKITDLKEFADVDCVTETSICSLLQEIIDKDCPTNVYQDITEQVVDSFMFLVHASALLKEDSNEVFKFVEKIISDFKDCDHIPFQLLSEIYTKLPLLELLNLLPQVIKFAFSKKLKYFKRSQYLQLLITFYSNNRLFNEKDMYMDSFYNLEEKIIKKVLKSFKNEQNHAEFNNKYCCMIFDLLSLMKLKNIKVEGSPSDHWNLIKDIINSFSEMPSVKKQLKISFKNFCHIFNNDVDGTVKVNNKKNKRKSVESGEEIPSPKSKKAKKKVSINDVNNLLPKKIKKKKNKPV